MVNILQIVISLLYSQLPDQFVPSLDPKSVAVIGAGSAGLAMLKALFDLPETTRDGWRIVLYEQRGDVAGVWLPDPHLHSPPDIPETPLYPLLHTNTPVPSMSYPGFPFPPGTPLYPSHEHVREYHQRYAMAHNLTQYIQFNHEVLETRWVGNSEYGHWNISVRNGTNEIHLENFDHLVVASGNNHVPRIPVWPGQDEWLKNGPDHGPKREILHSIYYRGPERYFNKSILIVGTGASGQDVAIQVSKIATKTYVSSRHDRPPIDQVEFKPEISHFTENGIIFQDGTTCNVDAVLLATGYEMRKPFLDAGHALLTDPSVTSNSSSNRNLTTNLHYIFPLHQHIFSLSPAHPVNALAFIGLPTAIANCPSDLAQSIFATHIIRNRTILSSREELLDELAAYEHGIRQRGYDPYIIGHQLLNGTSSDYQDELIDFLKKQVRGCDVLDGFSSTFSECHPRRR